MVTLSVVGTSTRANGYFRAKDKQDEANYQQMKEMLMKEIERYFRPEFIGRLDDVIVHITVAAYAVANAEQSPPR